jgi:hypothetical protein
VGNKFVGCGVGSFETISEEMRIGRVLRQKLVATSELYIDVLEFIDRLSFKD